MAQAPNLDRILRQHLATDLLMGVDKVLMSDLGLPAYDNLPQPAAIAPPPTAPALPSPSNTAPQAFKPAHMPLPHPAPILPPAPVASTQNLFGGPVTTPRSTADLPNPPDSMLPKAPRLTRDQKLKILTEMDENEVKPCVKCNLCATRTNTVFGEGDPDARLMFIGEGPGEDEDLTGRPFVGKAGQKLTEMIVNGMKIPRESVYIANVVKCRPPGNRLPQPDEVLACSAYLRRQIETVQPRVIVALGASAMKTLLQSSQGITAMRGSWQYLDIASHDGKTIPVMPTFHPAYLLRSYTPENRRKVWEDLKKSLNWAQFQPPSAASPELPQP
jgi:uracil-DNA glycosylase